MTPLLFLFLYWLFVSYFVPRLFCLANLLIHTSVLKGERSELAHVDT